MPDLGTQPHEAGKRLADGRYDIDLHAEVLVVGGSLAGIWSAIAAAEAGASVVLAEKGWVGTAGVVAAVGAGGAYFVPGDDRQREGMLTERHKEAEGLDDLAFLADVYERSYRSFLRMAEWGFTPPNLGAFGVDAMLFLRRKARRSGVRLLDHSPALELLAGDDGAIAGAAGVQRQHDRSWRVRAGAVILATGGNAFLSGAQGTNGSTGDGYLMASEAGASLIGMEFATSYAIAPFGTTTTKGGMYFQGHAYDDRGTRLDPDLPAWFAIPDIAKAIRDGRQPYYILDKVPPERRDAARRFVPNFYQHFERRGINPFEDFWPVTLVLEGSVRASGGIAIDDDCATEVPGLYAIGDVADKSRLTGAFLGGAGPCVAWCVVSAERAARGAARFSRRPAPVAAIPTRPLGAAGVRPDRRAGGVEQARTFIASAQAEIIPLDKGFWRSGASLAASLDALASLWSDVRGEAGGASGRDAAKAREAASLAASARWVQTAAQARRESRGLHRRTDHPSADPAQRHHLRVRGTDRIAIAAQDNPRATLPVHQPPARNARTGSASGES